MDPNPIDKTGWPDGPWMTEPDFEEWRNDPTGYRCCIHRVPHEGHLVGAIFLPEEFPDIVPATGRILGLDVGLDSMNGVLDLFVVKTAPEGPDGVEVEASEYGKRVATFRYYVDQTYYPSPDMVDETSAPLDQYKDFGLLVKMTNELAFQIAEFVQNERLVSGAMEEKK